ncbi:MAG TPA: NADH-quinone oxidoreductase subunit NuoG [Geobacteraceae bacterium]
MARLTIDNIPVEVPAGSNVLEAARRAGIWIPHFCYHPALGSVGACRLCAMKFVEGPVKGVQMACMVPAQDGMVVSTTDTDAARLRQLVIEWLMLNHPHDCPVCDEGGECLLQDYTVAGGHGVRRFAGSKRTHVNQELGPHIEHEMNRCIQCYRCARFYQEYAGGSDFGVLGSASRVYFGRFRDGELASPFAGNLVDICPTGVFTDKTARFRARYWDYQLAPSVCPHCSLGCTTTPAARYRELLKVMARRNDAVNGWFICDRGRFANSEVNDPARPRTPLVDGRETSWDGALDAFLGRLAEVQELYGPESIAVVGSPRLALEGSALLPRLAVALGAGTLSFFTGCAEAALAAAIAAMPPERRASQAAVRAADCIVVADCDLLEEGPMLALALRQAWRSGARLFAVGQTPVEELARTLAVAIDRVDSLAAVPLEQSKRPVVITGSWGTAALVAEAVAMGAALAVCLAGPNAFGASLIAREHGALPLDEAVASGRIKGIIAIEADIPAEILAQVPFIVAADWRPTATVQKAALVLPTTAWVEMAGTFINFEGRAQRFARVMKPGLPVRGLDPSGHPSHDHCLAQPGGEPIPAWQLLARLLERLGEAPSAEGLASNWPELRDLDPAGEGVILH